MPAHRREVNFESIGAMMGAVVVSMATIPSRIGLIDIVIDGLLAQTYGELDLRLYIPPACRWTGQSYDVPESLLARAEADARFSIRRIPTDYGSATKLLGPWEELGSADRSGKACVITVDDDVLLERHAIEELVDASARYPGDALGFMGATREDFVHAEHLAARGLPHATPSILGGYRAILYPLEVLDGSLADDYAAVQARCPMFLDDDHLFGWNLARRRVTRRVIATRHPGPDFAFNFQLLDFPDAITHGPDGGATVTRSYRSLIDYYASRRWRFPL